VVTKVFIQNFYSPSPKSDLDLGEGWEGGQDPSITFLTSFNTPSRSHLTNSSNNLSPPDDKPSGYSYEVRYVCIGITDETMSVGHGVPLSTKVYYLTIDILIIPT